MLSTFRRLREREEGFTLIELLIVVAVLGILAAIVIFAVANFTSTATTASCQTQGKSIETAVGAYYAQNKAYPPFGTSLTGTPQYLKPDFKTISGTMPLVIDNNNITYQWDPTTGVITTSGQGSCGTFG